MDRFASMEGPGQVILAGVMGRNPHNVVVMRFGASGKAREDKLLAHFVSRSMVGTRCDLKEHRWAGRAGESTVGGGSEQWMGSELMNRSRQDEAGHGFGIRGDETLH